MSELCNQDEEDLVEKGGGKEIEYRGRCQRDRGASRAQGVRHPWQQQGLRQGGRKGGQPKKIQYNYPPINKLESTGD